MKGTLWIFDVMFLQ